MLKSNTLFLCLLFMCISTYSQFVEMQKESVCFQDSVINDNVAELDFDVADKEEYYKVSKLEKLYTKTVLFEERYYKLTRYQGIDRYYFLPIFSVNPNESLKITAKFISNTENIDATTVKFMTTEGVVLTSKYDAATKEFTLTLPPSASGNSQRYFAVVEHQGRRLVLGGFEVMTYPEKSVNLTLVPVNKIGETNNPVDKNSIEQYLNKVYGVANVKFNIKLAESFDYNGETKFMENEKSGMLEEYTPAMLAMNNAYLEKVGDSFDKNSLYLFLLNFGAASGDMAGFMPRQTQIGYIFLNNNRVVERTVAHELGHGLAAMSHTFNAKYGTIPEGTTTNLMDYGDGIAMQKLQWDALHSKVEVWKIFERDKDGMQKVLKTLLLPDYIFASWCMEEQLKRLEFTNIQNEGWGYSRVTANKQVGNLKLNVDYTFNQHKTEGKYVEDYRMLSRLGIPHKDILSILPNRNWVSAFEYSYGDYGEPPPIIKELAETSIDALTFGVPLTRIGAEWYTNKNDMLSKSDQPFDVEKAIVKLAWGAGGVMTAKIAGKIIAPIAETATDYTILVGKTIWDNSQKSNLNKAELDIKNIQMEGILNVLFPKDLNSNYIDDMKTKLYNAWQLGEIRCTINFIDFLEGAMAIKNGRSYSEPNEFVKKHHQLWLYYAELYKMPTIRQLIDFLNGEKLPDNRLSEIIKGVKFELINQ